MISPESKDLAAEIAAVDAAIDQAVEEKGGGVAVLEAPEPALVIPETPVEVPADTVEDVRPDLEAATFAARSSMPSTIDHLGEAGSHVEAEEDIKVRDQEIAAIQKKFTTAQTADQRRDLINEEILARTAKLARLEALSKSGSLSEQPTYAKSFERDAAIERGAIDRLAEEGKNLDTPVKTEERTLPAPVVVPRRTESGAKRFMRALGAKLGSFTGGLFGLRSATGAIRDLARRRGAEANPPVVGGTTEVRPSSPGIEVELPKEVQAAPETASAASAENVDVSRLVGMAEDFNGENLSRGVIDELFEAGGTTSFNKLLDTLDRQGQLSSSSDQKAKANRLLEAMQYLTKKGIVSGKGPTYKVAISEDAWKQAATQLEKTGAIAPKSRRGERPLRAGEEAMPEFLASEGEEIPAGFVRSGDQPVPVPKAPEEKPIGPMQDIPRPKAVAEEPAAKVESGKLSSNEIAAIDFNETLLNLLRQKPDPATFAVEISKLVKVEKFGDRTDKDDIAKVMNRIMFQAINDRSTSGATRKLLVEFLEQERKYISTKTGPDGKLGITRLDKDSAEMSKARATAKTIRETAEAVNKGSRELTLEDLEKDERQP